MVDFQQVEYHVIVYIDLDIDTNDVYIHHIVFILSK